MTDTKTTEPKCSDTNEWYRFQSEPVAGVTANQTTTDDDPDALLDGSYRTYAEFSAGEGDTLLRKHAEWTPPDDCADMTVPEMLMHIYRHRRGHAVAPNGHTCPFLSMEEWSRIADWAKELCK